ncbi:MULTISPECIES: hypothetical protein [Rhodococcus]|uniref:Uncharacterized protein n=1 Tax=Rhodococcus globerulus TaxID=33008 RepID=A0ABU4BMD3_RHOGO|nr:MULTISPECIES: hypothetical protein [Rhodococcus]MDV6265377.1 hypothetical protein [Rhodococcus globerulus]RZL25181.1 MAG: hypothetical protein EOP31_12910 [Rhodococcus sp. (in: high G+C Gram-positive bacteria)]
MNDSIALVVPLEGIDSRSPLRSRAEVAVQAGLWGYPLAHRTESWPPTLQAQGAGHNYLHRFERLKTADEAAHRIAESVLNH